MDVGSNRGQVLREAVRVAPDARHVAFEPIPSLAAEIERELPAVEYRNLALGAASGKARFCHFTKLDGWSGLRRNPEISDERGGPEYIDVGVSTLDEQFPDLGPGLIKIDVEGAELQVLEGARGVLAGARPLLMFEHVAEAAELYESSSASLWDLLSGFGYMIFAVTGEGPFSRAAFGKPRPWSTGWRDRRAGARTRADATAPGAGGGGYSLLAVVYRTDTEWGRDRYTTPRTCCGAAPSASRASRRRSRRPPAPRSRAEPRSTTAAGWDA